MWDDLKIDQRAIYFQGPSTKHPPFFLLISDLHPQSYQNLLNIIVRELKLFGFVVTTLAPKYSKMFYKEMPAKVAKGEIKYQEDVTHGLETAGEVLLAMFAGQNNGKSVLKIADE